ncbi:ABC transporter permease subunit [Paenibacillus sp. HB172176]|uniref:ABC transporter permease subunit n=1 Tax=Paenibacillus sp. HB172176 TaxID=2493690 RepID=UPI00143C0797|nr:ABC transporter permease subunit [Paenibacillus sp. HB172176]
MNMYRFEVMTGLRAALLWGIALAAVAGFMMSLYPSFASDAEQFKQLLNGMPEAVLKGLDIEIDSITSLLGFYSYIFLYIALGGSIQAMHLGVSIVSKETREKTADFLLTKPVARRSILAAKTCAALTSLLITNAIYIAAAMLIAQLVHQDAYSEGALLLISLTLLFMQLIFLALGYAASMLMPRMRTVLPVSLGTVFAFFAISFISSSAGDGLLRYFTPFQFFDRAYIMRHNGYEATYLAIGAAVVAVCLGLSFLHYSRRDVTA